MATIFRRKTRDGKPGSYRVAYVDHTGKRRYVSAKTKSLKAAQSFAAEMEREVEKRRSGLVDDRTADVLKQSRRAIDKHLADFQEELDERNQQYVAEVLRHLGAFFLHADIGAPADITLNKAQRFLNKLRRDGAGNSTRHNVASALKRFSAWLVDNERLPADPLRKLKKPAKDVGKEERRPLLVEEWAWIRQTIEGMRRYVPAAERLLLYETAIATGLRASELRSLIVGKLFLDGPRPYVEAAAADTKNKKIARQYVPRALADRLAAHVANKVPQATVFKLPTVNKFSEMLKWDLGNARTAWIKAGGDKDSDFLSPVNDAGEMLNFHSLRHTCGTWLAQQTHNLKLVQTVMRHATITMTFDTYGHLLPDEAATAVSQLGAMMEAADTARGNTCGNTVRSFVG